MTNPIKENAVTNAVEFALLAQTDIFGLCDVTVHDGVFHADDVCSVALFATLVGLDRINVIRTRDRSRFAGAVIDVGEGRFDHHGSRSEIDSDGIPYSGLSRVWEVLKTEFSGMEDVGQRWFKKVVIDPVSKQDNGVTLDPGEVNLFSFVHGFNPAFDENTDPDTLFNRAVEAAYTIMRRYIFVANHKANEERELEKLRSNTEKVVVVRPGITWYDILPTTPAQFVVIPDDDGTVYVQCVSDPEQGQFSKKIPLPESWAGLRDDDFSKAAGKPDGVFCHIGRFICGFRSMESALDIANSLVK